MYTDGPKKSTLLFDFSKAFDKACPDIPER